MTDEIEKRIEQMKNDKVPEGYKREKGKIIPATWSGKKLGDVLQKVGKKVAVEKDVQYKQIGIRSHGKGLFYKEPVSGTELGNKTVFWLEEDCFVLNIVFAWEQAIGITTVNEVGMIGSHRFPMYRAIPNEVSIDYILWFFNTKRGKDVLAAASPGGAGRNKTLGQKEFANSKVYLPPFSEQEKIAEILTHCDKVINLKKQLISEEGKKKKWLMQILLNPDSGVRLEGFEGEWKEKTMGELFEFGPSISASREQLGETGTCYLHYGDIHSNTSGVVDVQRNFDSIPKLSIDSISSRVLLYDGDIVFVDASEDYEGASKYVVVKNENAIPFIAGLHTIAAKSIGEELVLDFKRFCFQSYIIKKQIAFYASGMKVFGLSKMNIAKILLKYPRADEQTAIANIISTADRKIDLLEQELAQWQLKKKSLMQLLLNGIVRVNV